VTALPKAAVPLIKLQTASVPTAFGAMAVIKMDISFLFAATSATGPTAAAAAAAAPSSSLLAAGQGHSQALSLANPALPTATAVAVAAGPTGAPAAASATASAVASTGAAGATLDAALPAASLAGPGTLRAPPHSWPSMYTGKSFLGLESVTASAGSGVGTSQELLPHGAHMGIENTRFVSRLCALHPPLAALVLVLKQLLHERGLNDPYKGGLGAYALTVSLCLRYSGKAARTARAQVTTQETRNSTVVC